SSSITINSVGFNSTCGSVPQGNNTANVSISLPVATITKTDITCFGAADGTINVSGSGGTSPYTFSINNGVNYSSPASNSQLFVGLLPNTTYQIKVKDANGCISN